MSIINVARQAGVSIATVSRAFNAPESVAPATRTAVTAAAAELGYEPNLSARTLRTQRSRTLGVVLPTLRNPVFAETLAGIAGAAADAGYSIIPLTTDYLEAQELQALRLLSGRSVDGLILTVADAERSATLAALKRARRPYVLAYNRHPRHPCVSVDGETAMAELVARLQQLGHRRILMVSGHLSASDRAQQRYRGYAAAMQAAHSPAELLELPFIDNAPEQLLQRLGGADRQHRPTALVCSNDLLALRCMRAAALAGLRVPEDLSVIGFDGMALGTELRPSLASISQPNEGIGRRSVAWLLDCLDTGKSPRAADSLTLPHQLRELESMRAPSCSNL